MRLYKVGYSISWRISSDLVVVRITMCPGLLMISVMPFSDRSAVFANLSFHFCSVFFICNLEYRSNGSPLVWMASMRLHTHFHHPYRFGMAPVYHIPDELHLLFYNNPNLLSGCFVHNSYTARNCVHNPHKRYFLPSQEMACCSR